MTIIKDDSFVNTEGCCAVFRDEYSRDVMEELGYGGTDTAKMLAPGDIADMVWDVVNKPDTDCGRGGGHD